MPTVGPSLLFAAGLTLGIGAGVFYPRKTTPIDSPFSSSALPGDAIHDVIPPKPISSPSAGSVLQGGFPGYPLVVVTSALWLT